MSKKVSLQRATQAMNSLIEATAKLNKHQANCQAEMVEVRQSYQSEMDDAATEITEAEAIIEKYTEQNREDLLQKGAKSTDFAGGKIGYRLAPKSLQLQEGKSWDDVLAIAKKKQADMVLTKESIDKAALKKADTKVLKKLGVTLVQEEHFFVKL